jgi:hypothetical protein
MDSWDSVRDVCVWRLLHFSSVQLPLSEGPLTVTVHVRWTEGKRRVYINKARQCCNSIGSGRSEPRETVPHVLVSKNIAPSRTAREPQ